LPEISLTFLILSRCVIVAGGRVDERRAVQVSRDVGEKMTQTLNERSSIDTTTPQVIVSADSHIGPLGSDYRQYCPKEHLESFDAWLKQNDAMVEMMSSPNSPFRAGDTPEAKRLAAAIDRNAQTAGHHDVHARLRDMDVDGVAAEVMFHGSQNGQGVPWVQGPGGFTFAHDADKETLAMNALGIHMYNHVQADMISVAPERLIGASVLPLWDIEASVKEVEWCAEHGLRAVSFPAPRRGLLPFDDPAYEPFWSACEDTGTVLTTHAGAIDIMDMMGTPGPQMACLVELEAGGWMARRGLGRLVFGAVFEKHPKLNFVVAEQNGDWWPATVREYDSSYFNHRHLVGEMLPEPPSFYLERNVYIGASFIARFEAEMAVEGDYWHNVIWGRDYPHIEGCFVYDENDSPETNRNRQHLRWAFNGLGNEPVKAMLGDNGLRVYGLDAAKLQEVANRIGAPTLDELNTPIDGVPDDGGILAFRTIGAWW
jgi:predicted TIM-barrel fold metal-dependent hydrolase